MWRKRPDRRANLLRERRRWKQRLSLIALGVADLDRARAFYERLGWRRTFRKAEGVVFFQVGRMALAFWPRDEVDAVLAEAVAAGARLLKPAQQAFWGGYQGYFADPDGHLWGVAWNPGFALDAKGNVTLPE